MAKKMTRDVPLPSSDGMFGGSGDPKKIKARADSLMSQSRYKKNNAALLEDKAKNTKDRFPTRYAFEGREYLTPGRFNLEKKAQVIKASAKLDSMRAEGLYNLARKNEAAARNLKDYRKKNEATAKRLKDYRKK